MSTSFPNEISAFPFFLFAPSCLTNKTGKTGKEHTPPYKRLGKDPM